MNRMSIYRDMFFAFFKIGLFTFGGGYAMMPLFRQELIEKQKYITENELLDYYSIGQCTPGIIAVNVATFTGYKIKGIRGAVMATFAIILPSLIIITLLAGILNTISEYKVVSHAFEGIRVAVIALILNEVIKIYKKAVTTKFQFGIFILILLLVFGLSFSATTVVFTAIGIGLCRGITIK